MKLWVIHWLTIWPFTTPFDTQSCIERSINLYVQFNELYFSLNGSFRVKKKKKCKYFCSGFPKLLFQFQFCWIRNAQKISMLPKIVLLSVLMTKGNCDRFQNCHYWLTIPCKGSYCCTAVECTPCNREIMGSFPFRCWAYFSFYPQ